MSNRMVRDVLATFHKEAPKQEKPEPVIKPRGKDRFAVVGVAYSRLKEIRRQRDLENTALRQQ